MPGNRLKADPSAGVQPSAHTALLQSLQGPDGRSGCKHPPDYGERGAALRGLDVGYGSAGVQRYGGTSRRTLTEPCRTGNRGDRHRSRGNRNDTGAPFTGERTPITLTVETSIWHVQRFNGELRRRRESLQAGMSHTVTLTIGDHELGITSVTTQPWTTVTVDGDLEAE